MKYCSLCNVQVDTEKEFCPLCHNAMDDLTEKTTLEMFPEYKQPSAKKKSLKKLAVKICLILSVLIIAFCVFINIQTETMPWSVIVAFIIIYFWVLIAHTILSRSSAFDKVFFELSAICAFLVSTNMVFSSTEWFVKFVYPGVSILATIVLTIMLMVRKDNKSWVFSFFCILLLMTVVSLVFLIFKIDSFKIINIINVLFQAVTMFAYLLFDSKTILAEASRKFHI